MSNLSNFVYVNRYLAVRKDSKSKIKLYLTDNVYSYALQLHLTMFSF